MSKSEIELWREKPLEEKYVFHPWWVPLKDELSRYNQVQWRCTSGAFTTAQIPYLHFGIVFSKLAIPIITDLGDRLDFIDGRTINAYTRIESVAKTMKSVHDSHALAIDQIFEKVDTLQTELGSAEHRLTARTDQVASSLREEIMSVVNLSLEDLRQELGEKHARLEVETESTVRGIREMAQASVAEMMDEADAMQDQLAAYKKLMDNNMDSMEDDLGKLDKKCEILCRDIDREKRWTEEMEEELAYLRGQNVCLSARLLWAEMFLCLILLGLLLSRLNFF